jgi:hypothetical protein
MANKGSGKTYTSKGERKSVSPSVTKAARREYVGSGEQLINQLKALKQGKNVRLSLINIGKDGKRHPNTVLKINGKQYIAAIKGGFKAASE